MEEHGCTVCFLTAFSLIHATGFFLFIRIFLVFSAAHKSMNANFLVFRRGSRHAIVFLTSSIFLQKQQAAKSAFRQMRGHFLVQVYMIRSLPVQNMLS